MSFFDFGFDDKSDHSRKVSSFFDDTEETKEKENRQGPSLEDDGDDENNDHSEVEMKVPKKIKVDTSLGPVNIEFANIADKDINDNTKSVEVQGNSSDLLSDTLRDAIEEMRSQMLAMIPDIKRQEEASDTILGRVTVLESDINNYREQLAEVKHEYISRLSLVSSILQGGR